ncbi:unnamed protein product [Urochloa humidicola]
MRLTMSSTAPSALESRRDSGAAPCARSPRHGRRQRPASNFSDWEPHGPLPQHRQRLPRPRARAVTICRLLEDDLIEALRLLGCPYKITHSEGLHCALVAAAPQDDDEVIVGHPSKLMRFGDMPDVGGFGSGFDGGGGSSSGCGSSSGNGGGDSDSGSGGDNSVSGYDGSDAE